MRTISLIDIIKLSIERTKVILFQPFNFKKWMKLLFIAMMAGALGAGSGGGSGQPVKKADAEQPFYQTTDDQGIKQTAEQKLGLTIDENTTEFAASSGNQIFHKYFGWMGTTTLIFFIILLTIIILMMIWLSCRFRFIWLDAIIHNQTLIIKPFHQYKKLGNSYFKFTLAMSSLSFLLSGIVISAAIFQANLQGLLSENSEINITFLLNYFLLPIIFILIMTICLILLFVFIENFVVVIMALDNLTFVSAWKKFIIIYKDNSKEMWIYILSRIGLSFAAGIINILLVFIVFAGAVMIAGLFFGSLYLILSMLLHLDNFFMITAVTIGIPFIFCLIILFLLSSLPLNVFVKCFSLYFFSSLNAGYAPLILPITSDEKIIDDTSHPDDQSDTTNT